MKIRTTVYIPWELHDDLKQLAFFTRSSMSHLLEAAAETTFKEDLQQFRRERYSPDRIKKRRAASELLNRLKENRTMKG